MFTLAFMHVYAAASLAAPQQAQGQAQAGRGGQRDESRRSVTCESPGTYRRCAVSTNGMTVSIDRKLSKADCVQGRTWGFDKDGIWVNQGCRAVFAIGKPGGGNPGGGGNGTRITCESPGGRRTCAANTSRGVHLSRQLSRAECQRNHTWGTERDYIWVDDGCRAEFTIGGGSGGGSGGNREEQVRCESGGGFLRCPTPLARRGVRLVRQLSNAACTEDATWGHDRDAIWVDRGCRGIFESGDPVANRGERVTCASDGGFYQCPADTNDGIRLLRQLSKADCTPGESWGYDRGRIWVDRGCRAEFQAGGGYAPIRKQ